jgi:MSHA biogenesis protein MshK
MALPGWLDIAAACALAMAASGAGGQGLSDPTRPPSGFYTVLGGPAQAGEGRGALILQSVLIHPDARSAIISGEHVQIGQKVGSMRLVKVGETEVVLLDGAERRTLKLFPGVEKRPAGAHAAGGAPR